METHPPFTNVGMDVFGPWQIQVKKLRGSAANAKRWSLVFTCLSTRGTHIEILHSMDANSIICALRHFFAICGQTAVLRCDCSTNFVGAKSELDSALKGMDKEKMCADMLRNRGANGNLILHRPCGNLCIMHYVCTKVQKEGGSRKRTEHVRC